MPAFRFEHDPIVEYRRRVEEARKMDHALGQRAVTDANGRLYSYLNEEKCGREALRAAERECLDVGQVRAQVEYLTELGRRIGGARAELQRLILRERELAERLRVAVQERKAIEKLRELRSAAYVQAVSRDEQKLVDEMASLLSRLGPGGRALPRTGAEGAA